MFIGRFQPAKVNMVLAAVVVWAFAFVIFAVVNTLVSSTPGVVVMVVLSLVWMSIGAICARSWRSVGVAIETGKRDLASAFVDANR